MRHVAAIAANSAIISLQHFIIDSSNISHVLVQRTKDMKLEELNAVREHENACRKLKHRLELGVKRDKVCSACRAVLCCAGPL